MLREPWWQPHDRHAEVVDRRDVELDAAHELAFALEFGSCFARRGDIDACT